MAHSMSDCDRCGARGLTEWTSERTGQELVLCGHHGRENGPALTAQGFEVRRLEQPDQHDATVPA